MGSVRAEDQPYFTWARKSAPHPPYLLASVCVCYKLYIQACIAYHASHPSPPVIASHSSPTFTLPTSHPSSLGWSDAPYPPRHILCPIVVSPNISNLISHPHPIIQTPISSFI